MKGIGKSFLMMVELSLVQHSEVHVIVIEIVISSTSRPGFCSAIPAKIIFLSIFHDCVYLLFRLHVFWRYTTTVRGNL